PDDSFVEPEAVESPAADSEVPADGSAERPLQLVYSGKFARPWQSLEIPRLPDRLAEHGLHAHVTMIGDKIQHSPSDRAFPAEMRATMARRSDRVTWAGGMSRDEAML